MPWKHANILYTYFVTLIIIFKYYNYVIVSNEQCNFFLARPGMLDFKGKAKWDAWDRIKGMNQDTAKEKYVQKVEQLVSSIGKK